MQATTLDVPKNVFLCWGAAMGELVVEGDFVDFWRLKIGSDFMKKDIEALARDVLGYCKGGKMYTGLDPSMGRCRGGVWINKGHLGPSAISAEQKQELMQKCITFAGKALRSNFHF